MTKDIESTYKSFVEEVKDIIIFPGSISELQKLKKEGEKHYELMPMNGANLYLRGSLLPSKEQVNELLTLTISTAGEEYLEEYSEELEYISETMFNKMYMSTNIRHSDIRIKVKRNGSKWDYSFPIRKKHKSFV